MPHKPPPGWATLQEKARHASNPTELANIIDEMNQMLAEHEESTGDHGRKPQSKKQRGTKRPGTIKKK